MSAAKERIVNLDGTPINVRVEGAGRTVVLLHGWSYDLRLWDSLSPNLVRAGWRVVRWDMRGHGRSPARGPYEFSQLSQDLDLLIAQLAPGRPVLCGLSLGGFLAMRRAIDHPESVGGLVLADTWIEPIPSDVEMASTLPSTADGPDALGRWWWERNARGADLDADPIRRAARDRFATLDADGLRHAIAACATREPVTEADLGNITAPTLVIAGEHDRYFTPARHTRIARAIGARLEILPGAGHISVRDAPRDFARHVLDHLRGLPTHEAENTTDQTRTR